MATSYHVFTTGDEPVATRAKKTSAIAYGDNLFEPYRVVTDSGKVVHEVHEAVVQVDDACLHCGNLDEHDANCPSYVDREEQAHMETNVDGVANEADQLDAEEKPKRSRKAKAEEPEPVTAEQAEAEADALVGDTGTEADPKKFDIKAMKAKISKLLAKAERTENAAERDAFNAKAEKLMVQMGLQRAELEAAGEVKAEKVVEVHRDYASVYAMDMCKLIIRVTNGIGHITILRAGSWSNCRVYIIGHDSDVKRATQLLNSLDQQVMTALKTWQKANKGNRSGMSNYNKLVGNRSFIAGFGSTIEQRLTAMREQVEGTASKGAELVFVGKDERVSDYMSENHANVKEGRGGRAQFDLSAAADGLAAGQSADLGEKAVGGNAGELA